MDAAQLRGRLLRVVESPLGPLADLMIMEPNGDEYLVRCLAKKDGTDITGDGEAIAYLNHRYGEQVVCTTARSTALSSWA